MIDPKPESVQETPHQERVEFKLFAKIKMKPGLKLYGLNISTMDVKEIDVKKEDTFSVLEQKATSKAYTQERMIFFQSLNMKNARKRVAKFLRGDIKELSNVVGKVF
jgi:hypothetical protein